MANTFNKIWRAMSLYNTDIPPRLIQDWTNEAWTKVYDSKLWSWAVEEDQFTTILAVPTCDITVTNGSTTVTATVLTPFLDPDHVGLQLKIDGNVFTIDSVTSPTVVELDRAWPLETGTQSGNVQTVYVAAPTDFYGFVSVIDVQAGTRIWTNIDMKHIDRADPKRNASGNPTVLADRKWKTSPSSATTVPTYELWPNPSVLRAYRFLYWKVPADFSRVFALPHTISDRLIKNYVRAQMATWPGTTERPNRMQSRVQAAEFMKEFRDDLQDSMIKDDEIYDTDLWIDTKMTDLHGPIGRTEAGPFPLLHF